MQEETRFRRESLFVEANPAPQRDYVITLRGTLDFGDRGELVLRYVPDKYVLPRAAFSEYCSIMARQDWPMPESRANEVLDDMNNELVPRWVSVRLIALDGHEIVLEDRQPDWSNDSLLSAAG